MRNGVQFESTNLRLKHLDAKDKHDFITLVTADTFGKFLPFGKVDYQRAEIYFEKALNAFVSTPDLSSQMDYQIWRVMDIRDKQLAGFIGYESVVFEDIKQTMMFLIFSEESWQTTIPLEASQLVCNDAFTHGISKLIAFINPQDIKAISVMSEMKFTLIKEVLCFGATMLLFALEKEV